MKASESIYKAAFEQATTGICHVGLDGSIIEANQTFSKIVDYSQQELSSLKVLNLVTVSQRKAYHEPIEKLLKGTLNDFSCELPLIKKNGQETWVHLNATLMKSEDGTPLSIILILNDVNEKVAFEQELQIKNLELHMIEEIGKAITKNLDFDGLLLTINKTLKHQMKFDALLLFDYQGDSDTLTLKAYTGICDQEAMAFKALSFENSITGGAIACASIKQASLENYPVPELDFYYKTKGFTHIVTMPIYPDDQPIGALAMLFKKAPSKNFVVDPLLKAVGAQLAIGIHNAKLYQDLKNAKQSAENANRVKGDFLATISHEIRTPLHAVIGFSELLKHNRMSYENVEHINGIQVAAQSLLTLINKILDLSKIEAGMMVIKEEKVSLRNIFKDVEQIFAQSAHKKGLTLRIEIDPMVPKCIWLDNGRITQVLINLIGNAVKFTEKGTILISAKVGEASEERGGASEGPGKTTEETGEPSKGTGEPSEGPCLKTMALELVVTDTGIGIHPQYLDSIFDPFQQPARQETHQQTQQYEGTGLGLAICKRLIDIMGGTISVASDFQAGTTFKIELPNVRYMSDGIIGSRVQLIDGLRVGQGPQNEESNKGFHGPGPSGEKLAKEEPRENSKGSQVLFAQATVLVVDDDPLNLRLMKALLEPLGIMVHLATDGHMGIRICSQVIPDLILMDLRMPTFDGRSTAQHIRKNPNTKHIPIVALTAHQILGTLEDGAKSLFQANQRPFLEHYFDDYMLKPVEIKRVQQLLSHYLGHKQIYPKTNRQGIQTISPIQRRQIIDLLEPSVSKLKVVLNSKHLSELIANLKQLNVQFEEINFIEIANRLERYRSGWDLTNLRMEIDQLVELLKDVSQK